MSSYLHLWEERIKSSEATVSDRNWGVSKGSLTLASKKGKWSSRTSRSHLTHLMTALNTLCSDVINSSSSDMIWATSSRGKFMNSSVSATFPKNFLTYFWHALTKDEHPSVSANDLTPSTLLGQSLAIRNWAHASLTRDNCKKFEVIIRLCTFEVLIVTFPLKVKENLFEDEIHVKIPNLKHLATV